MQNRGGSDTGAVAIQQPPLPRAPVMHHHNNVPRMMEFVRIGRNGTVVTEQVRKSQLAAHLGVPVRDLRLIDASFPGTCAAFVVRRGAILLCVERVKAVIRRDEVLLFDPDIRDVQTLVPLLQQQLAAAAAGGASSSSSSRHSSYAPPPTPFEHLALEAILANGCHSIHERLQQLAPHVLRILGDLRFRHGTLNSFTRLLDELLPLRNRLSELHYTVQELRKAINDVLISDEDMAQMYLTSAAETGRHRRVDQHSEVEMLFENYLMQLEWSDTDIKEIQQAVKNTEDTVEIQLDLLRNRILRFELFLSIFSSVVGVGALVTGAFGMNMLSGLETHPKAFWGVFTGLAGAMVALFMAAIWYGVKGKVL